VRIWNTSSGRETATLPDQSTGTQSVAFAPDGRTLASASEDGTVRIWESSSGRETATLRGHQGQVVSLAFAPGGRRLASASEDGTVRIWDTASGRETATLRGGRGRVRFVAFAPDGQTLASASGDGAVQLWDAAPLTPERRVHREAIGLVRLLVGRSASSADLRDRIRRDPTVSEQVRGRALELADGHWHDHMRRQVELWVGRLLAEGRLLDEVEEVIRGLRVHAPEIQSRTLEAFRRSTKAWDATNDASWKVAREPGREPSVYLLALRRAESVCRYAPENGLYLNTLGVAQYRAGLYRDTVATLTRSNTLNGGRAPADLAFLAMAHHRLGQTLAAHQALAQLRAAMKTPSEIPNPTQDAAFLREAEVLIELDPAFPPDPFAR
jgi:hypothetical protein